MPGENTIFSTLTTFSGPEEYFVNRDSHFKELENSFLFRGILTTSPIISDSKGNPTVGYGFNLSAKTSPTEYRSLETKKAYFTHVFGTLTAEQMLALRHIDDYNSERIVSIGGESRKLKIADILDGVAQS